MSNPFDRPSGPTGPDGPQRPGGNGGSGGARPASTSRRPGALVITAIVLVLAFMLLSAFASFWTERLWFGSVGYQEVFTTLLLTRIGLFFVFAGLMAAVGRGGHGDGLPLPARPVARHAGDARRRDGPLPPAGGAAHGLGRSAALPP